MDTAKFLAEAGAFCQAGNACDDAGDEPGAIRHFKRALQMYRQVQQCEPDVLAQALLQGQCDALMRRITELREGGDDDEALERRLDALGERLVPVEDDTLTTTASSTTVTRQRHATETDEHILTRFDTTTMMTQTLWSDVVGMETVKEELLLQTKRRRQLPHLFDRGTSGGCLLLYGPPGTGKTMLARALACECGLAFFAPSSADIASRYVGDCARNMRGLFDTVRAAAPAILFLDEVDALCPHRDKAHLNEEARRGVTELLLQIDGVGTKGSMHDVLVVAATNYPWDIDAAALRRMPERFYVPLPDQDARLVLLKQGRARHSQGVGEPVSDQALARLAQELEGYSGSDIAELYERAYKRSVIGATQAGAFGEESNCIVPLPDGPVDLTGSAFEAIEQKNRFRPRALTEADLRQALREVKPVLRDLSQYEEWTRSHGTEAC